MTTELMLLGLKCQTTFNSWMGSFPVKWDDTTHQFIFKRHPSHLKFYYFHVFFVAGCFNAGCILEVVVNRTLYPTKDFNTSQFAMYAVGLVLIGFTEALAIGLLLDGRELIETINALILHLRHLRGGRKHFKRGAIRRNPKWTGKLKELITEEDGSLDMMGLSMMYFAGFSLWYGSFFAILALVLDINPIKMCFYDIFPAKVMRSMKIAIPALFFYFAVFVSEVTQGIRLVQVVVIIAVVPAQFYTRITSELNKAFVAANKVKEFEKVHLEYMKFKLINMFVAPIVQKQAFIMMQVGKWASVVCVFVALKLNKYLESIIIVSDSVAAFAIMAILGLSIPYLCKTSQVSIDTLKEWNDKVALRSPYLKRKYKAMYSIMFPIGLPGIKFSTFEQSTTTDFFMSIADTLIDLSIGYPDEDIKMFFQNQNNKIR